MLEKKIVDDVNDQANLVINQINSEIKVYKEDELDHFKLSVKKEIEAYYHAELNELKLDTASLISQIQLKTKRDLLKVRQDLASDLFNEVQNRLLTYVASKEYKGYLIKKIKKYEYDFNQGYFEVAIKDVALFKEILKSMNYQAEVRETTILIGGFLYTSPLEMIQVDETIDSMLNEQKDWFQDNSGFIL